MIRAHPQTSASSAFHSDAVTRYPGEQCENELILPDLTPGFSVHRISLQFDNRVFFSPVLWRCQSA